MLRRLGDQRVNARGLVRLLEPVHGVREAPDTGPLLELFILRVHASMVPSSLSVTPHLRTPTPPLDGRPFLSVEPAGTPEELDDIRQ